MKFLIFVVQFTLIASYETINIPIVWNIIYNNDHQNVDDYYIEKQI
jgi:hypothetical protein